MILSTLCLAALYTGWTFCRVAAHNERVLSAEKAELLAARALGEQHTSTAEPDAAQTQSQRRPRIHRATG
jgi:hypothetical protein